MLALLAALAATPAAAQEIWSEYDPEEHQGAPVGYGLGVILGDPTGISGSRRTESQKTTLAGALAWSLPNNAIHVHGDYLFTVYIMEDPYTPGVSFPFYVGLGGRVRVGGLADNETFDLGVRVPFGASVLFERTEIPVDLFLELVPVVGLFPSTGFDMDGALGVRVYPFGP